MGYLGDIGVPAVPGPMDFSAWFEVFLGDRWYTFDARHNRRRIGGVVMARGRDGGDVPITMCFGPSLLTRFDVVTDEAVENALTVLAAAAFRCANLKEKCDEHRPEERRSARRRRLRGSAPL